MHDASTYGRLYDNAVVNTWSSAPSRLDWSLIGRVILERVPQGGRVLDFGCYTGGFLARLAPAYERYGVEINRTAAALASKDADARIWSTVDEIPKDLSFDVVIAADVLEHMANPKELIAKLAALLSSRGVLIISTGDGDNSMWNRFGANWWYCFFNEHLAFLSKAWFEYIAGELGLSILHYQVFRYSESGAARRVIDGMLMFLYGRFPITYLFLAKTLGMAFGRQDVATVPGSGVTADHFLIVLSRKGRHE